MQEVTPGIYYGIKFHWHLLFIYYIDKWTMLLIILLSLCTCHVEMIFLNRIRVKMLNENNIIYLQHLKPLISDSCLKVQQAWYFSNQCMSCFEDYRNVTQRAYYSLMGWPVYSLFFFSCNSICQNVSAPEAPEARWG